MKDKIKSIETYKVRIPRDTPYLGKLQNDEVVNANGYFVRKANKSIYSIYDQSLLVKITTDSGKVGWGECVAFIGPEVTETIVKTIIEPQILGRSPIDVVAIYEDLYNAMRVRGFFGGFYLDAISAVDIALWDLKGKILNKQICEILGSSETQKVKAYVSGLPVPTTKERAELAKQWQDKGFDAVKLPIVLNVDAPEIEVKALREAMGEKGKILVDMHWRYTSLEAINLIERMNQYDLYLAEAPVRPEDIEGQAHVVKSVKTNVGIGEELRTIYEYIPRFVNRCMNVIQPEMGRTGITAFVDICRTSLGFNQLVMPHASIGIGIFQAASLHASVTLSNCVYHEYQHSIFDKNLEFLTGNMRCDDGYFILSEAAGLGVEPTEELLEKYTY